MVPRPILWGAQSSPYSSFPPVRFEPVRSTTCANLRYTTVTNIKFN